jgi:aspartyl-tRNA(Asn)/glutamyl-tRNA(Gln) amidotransferase subunit A
MSTDGVVSLGAKLKAGKADPVALAQDALDKSHNCDDQAIFLAFTEKRALAEAEAARKRLKDGKPASALDGIPTAWKALYDLAGEVTTAGSVVFKSHAPAKEDAEIVKAAKVAGAVTLGILNMTEFAYSAIGLNPHYGTPRNPNDPKVHRFPGGSSSGSAVAVARGIIPFAMGSDTGGSIRIPAALNGLVGYKASTGLHSMKGVFPLSRTLDSLGPLAHSVEDCVTVDAALRKARPVTAADISSLRIIVPATTVLDDCDEAATAHFESAIDRLGKAGAKITRQPFPAFQRILATIAARGHLLGAEALHVHRDLINSDDAQRMDHRVQKRIKLAEKMLAVDLVEVLAVRKETIAETNAQIGDALVAFPTVAHVAKPLQPLAENDDEFFRVNLKTLRNTMLGNFLDWCGVTIPSGKDKDGMPVGFLLSATHGRDSAVLAAALGAEPVIRAGA